MNLCRSLLAAAFVVSTTAAALSQHPAYSVSGLALGGKVHFDSKTYRQYECKPSDQFDGFTWCQTRKEEEEKRGHFKASYSILHARDGTVVYVNRFQEPAYWSDDEVERDIRTYSRKVGAEPKIIKGPSRPRHPDSTIAVWGDLALEPLDNESRNTLAADKNVKRGILVDTIGDYTRSARDGLPLYRITGNAGFVWIGSNRNGRGTLRILAIAPSAFYPPAAPPLRPPPPVASAPKPEPPRPAPQTDTVFTGTAFFVAPNRLMTNNHVVNDCRKPIEIRFANQPSRRTLAYIDAQDAMNDLALLHTEITGSSVASFRLSRRLGERVATYGFPYADLLSRDGNFTLGDVSAQTGIKDDSRFLQVSVPIQPGNSGGPLLDMSGNVIGMITAQLSAFAMIERKSIPQNVNFAIGSPVITNFLQAKGVSLRLAGSDAAGGRNLSPADVADLAREFTVQVICKGTAP